MRVLFKEYTFDPILKQITFNSSDLIELPNVLLITNVTSNVVIYNFASSALGGSLSQNVLTLDYNTAAMASTDELQIFLDLYGSPASEPTLAALNDQIALMKRLLQLLNPIATQDSANRQRVVVEGSTIVAQASAANLNANVGNIASLGGVDARFQFLDQARTTYATSIRSNLKST
jgi:DNA-binding transcriptional regulator YbjK